MFVITPTFKDVFGNEQDSLSELLYNIPSDAVLIAMSYISSEIHFGKENKTHTQFKILNRITQRFGETDRELIIEKLVPFLSKNGHVFTPANCLRLSQFVLLNYQIADIEDTTPEQEFRIFKAYLLIAEEYDTETIQLLESAKIGSENDKYNLHFQRFTWPLLFDQFDLNTGYDATYFLFRASGLMSFIKNNYKYKTYLDTFLQKMEKDTYLNYIFDIAGAITLGYNYEENQYKVGFNSSDKGKVFWDLMSLNLGEYLSDKKNMVDYKGIRTKPLYKLENNFYLVMNWAFLEKQLYTGLIFNFYAQSGIKKVLDFDNYLSLLAEYTEKIFFKRILEKVLLKKHSVLMFDDMQEEGLPDAYYRVGKNIFFFELKDTLMNSNIIQSRNFNDIIADLTNKFIDSMFQFLKF